jgi:hypothetical protein
MVAAIDLVHNHDMKSTLESVFFWRRRQQFSLFLNGCHFSGSLEADEEASQKRGSRLCTKTGYMKIFNCPDHNKEIAAFL